MSDKFFLISDKTIENPNIEIGNDDILDCSFLEPQQVAEHYKKKIDSGKSYDAIFINAEAMVNGSNRSDLTAIELIFWLRLKHKYTGPIITYGFLSSAQILRIKPQYVVLHAPGNMHWRLGDELKVEEIPRPIPEDIIYSNAFRQYLKAYFDLNEFRHEEANWWSMKCLIDVHRVLDENTEYPAAVRNHLSKTNNIVATSLYGNFQLTKNDIKHVQLKKEIQTLEGQLKLLKTFPNPREEKKLTDNIHKLKAESSQLNGDPLNIKVLNVLNKNLNSDTRNVIHIDDLFENGWNEVYKNLFSESGYEFFAPKFNYKKSDSDVTSLCKAIESKIKELNEIYAVILDLRLLPDDHMSLPGNYSGIHILKYLKLHYPEIPVLITSASSKSITYRLCMEYGAEAYWMKLGIESKQTKNNQIENYLDLINKLNSFSKIEYKTKIKIHRAIKNLSTYTLWWQKLKWRPIVVTSPHNGKKIKIYGSSKSLSSNVVSKSLDLILSLFNRYIQLKFIINDGIDVEYEKTYFTAVASEIGKIIEAIHPNFYSREAGGAITTGFLAQSRGDSVGSDLYSFRNDLSHRSGSNKHTPINSELFCHKIDKFVQYITSKQIDISKKLKQVRKEKTEVDAKTKFNQISQQIEANKKKSHTIKVINEHNDLKKIGETLSIFDPIEKVEIFIKKVP